MDLRIAITEESVQEYSNSLWIIWFHDSFSKECHEDLE